MALMIPNVDPSQIEHTSEEPVYVALRDLLSNEFVVLHSYPWLRPWRGEGILTEGEADFVVLHPQHGLLVLEVKGGKTIRHDGHRWFRDTAEGPREFQDPFKQARRNMHALLDIVKERSGGRVRKDDFVHGYAVVFPHMDYEGEPPPHADRAIVISRRHLPFVDQSIVAAFRAWTAEPRPLAYEQYRTLLNDCLMPRFRVFRPIGPDISVVTDRLLELTETQAKVFEGLYIQDRVLVEGVAGSGKTFLALQRALAFARAGKRTLFVCYNKELAAWIRRQVAEDPTIAEYRTLLTVRNFHALAAELADAAGMEFRPVNGGQLTQAFWDDEVPDLLDQAVLALDAAGHSIQFQAIVVDEAQDFSLGWWYALTQSLLEVPNGPVYAFMDPNQSLRGEVQRPPVEFDARFHLNVNCRNTRKIAAASASILNLRPGTFARAPAGAELRILRASTLQHQKGLVLNELRKLLDREDVSPRQIAVIGPAAKAKGSLADVEEISGVRLLTTTDGWRDGEGLLITTARSFKGLEADVVLLYDLGDFSPLFRKEDLYVACTRAKALLIVVVHGAACRAVIDTAVTAAEVES
jgi:hypothetical protein